MISRFNQWHVWQSSVKVGDYELYADSLDRLLYLGLHRLRLTGDKEFALLRKLVKNGDHVVDVGANLGLYSCMLADLVGSQGRVDSFEPVPRLAACLQRNVERNGFSQVHVHGCALGEEPGEAIISSSFNSGDSHIVTSSAENSANLRVPVRRGDDELPGTPIHLIKIDVQGFEHAALQGLESTVDRSPGLKIIFEYWPPGIARAGFKSSDLRAWFASHGFQAHVIDSKSELVKVEWDSLDSHCAWKPWGLCSNFVAVKAS